MSYKASTFNHKYVGKNSGAVRSIHLLGCCVDIQKKSRDFNTYREDIKVTLLETHFCKGNIGCQVQLLIDELEPS